MGEAARIIAVSARSQGPEASAAAPPSAGGPTRRQRIKRMVSLLLALAIWFVPPPATLSVQAWHLFAMGVGALLAFQLLFATNYFSAVRRRHPVRICFSPAADTCLERSLPSRHHLHGLLCSAVPAGCHRVVVAGRQMISTSERFK